MGHDLSLAEAREKAGELRRALEEGEDPAAAKKAARARAEAARQGVGTVAAVIDHYYASGPGAALRTGAEQRKTIARVFRPLLGHVAGDLRRTELQLAADGYRSATTASAAVGALRPILKWSAKRGLVRDDNWAVLERPELRQRGGGLEKGQGDRRHLTADELKKLWPLLPGSYGACSRLILLTAVRLREATEASWAEIDLEAATWTIPAARRKDTRSKRRARAAPAADHVVPLSRQAVKLLIAVRETKHRTAKGTADLVFVGPYGGRLVNWSRWLASLHKTSGVEPWSAHALRRTAATFAAETGVEPHVVSALLGHRAIGGNALLSAYQRGRYSAEHRGALQRLADRVDIIVADANVMSLRGRS